MGKVNPTPEGYHTITPYLCITGAAAAIEFYKNAFGAEEHVRLPGADGKSVMHAEIKIGDSLVMLADECPGMGGKSPTTLKGTTGSLNIYVNDVDASFKRAIAAGARAIMPPENMFWGDRFCKIADPFGHEWSMATHIEDVPPQDMQKRMEEQMKQYAK
jgi:PhnB protein